MSLLDVVTGGKNKKASDALRRAEESFGNVPLPSKAELTLPELQKYVQAGLLTPAQAQAMAVKGNAFDDIKMDPAAMQAEMKALGQLQTIADAGGMDAQAKAKLSEAQNMISANERGNNAAIIDQFAQKGIPTSLMAAALQAGNAGQSAQNANLAATQAAGDAEERALQAISQSGNLAGNIQGQQYQQSQDKAAAQNTINQWNAANQSNMNLANAGFQQQANAANTANAQDVSNRNTGNSNTRTQYNANIPQQMFNNQITKAGGQAGVNQNQANMYNKQGEQEAGLWSSIIGGGMKFLAEGGPVPGEPEVRGDSPSNDKVHAMLSPGEIVLPRSVTTKPNAPELSRDFVQDLIRRKPVRAAHPEDVRSVLEALTMRRGT